MENTVGGVESSGMFINFTLYGIETSYSVTQMISLLLHSTLFPPRSRVIPISSLKWDITNTYHIASYNKFGEDVHSDRVTFD